MSVPNSEPNDSFKLRVDAEARLKAGSAPSTKGWVGVNALGLLHKLASAPEDAVDALKLLHELQVHQVELDLQHEQMEATQRELAEDLARYRGLFQYAPMAYLSLGPQREILESNIAAAALLGTGQDELRGSNLDSFLAQSSRPVLLKLLNRLLAGSPRGTCEVRSGAANDPRRLQILASVAPGAKSFLIVAVDLTDRTEHERYS